MPMQWKTPEHFAWCSRLSWLMSPSRSPMRLTSLPSGSAQASIATDKFWSPTIRLDCFRGSLRNLFRRKPVLPRKYAALLGHLLSGYVEVRDEIRDVSNLLEMTNYCRIRMATYETNPTDRSQTMRGWRFRFVIPSCF